MSEFSLWQDELAGARRSGTRWIRRRPPMGWAAAIVVAALAGPGVFLAALLLTLAIGAR